MPITKSAKKALRKDRRRTIINKKIKKKLKEAIRFFKKSPTVNNLKKVVSVVDQTAKKKLIHKGKADRLKSRLSKLLSKASVKTQKLPTKSINKIKKRVKKRINN